MATCWPHCPSPRPAQHHIERSSPEPRVPLLGNETQGGYLAPTVLWVTSWKPPLSSHPTGIGGNLWGLTTENLIMIKKQGTSLVAQRLRIRLPMQQTQVRALVREDPTCCGATKPMHHNYWACALEPASHNYWARVPQLLSPLAYSPCSSRREATAMRSLCTTMEE